MERTKFTRFSVRENDLIVAALEDYTDAATLLNAVADTAPEETAAEQARTGYYNHAVEAAYFAASDALFALIDAHSTAAVCRALEEQSLAELSQGNAILSPMGDTLPMPEPLIRGKKGDRTEGMHPVKKQNAAKKKVKNGIE